MDSTGERLTVTLSLEGLLVNRNTSCCDSGGIVWEIAEEFSALF